MDASKDSEVTNPLSVSDAYAGKSIFVTGGTGFLGKVFIEKILYDCPKIFNIYVLVRKGRNESVEEKVRNMLAMPVFDRLRAKRPQDLDKIIAVPGDIELPKLGLRPEDEETLVNAVSMVFHMAATVRFTEPLQKALKINLIGTKSVLDMCLRISNIEAFIYVSTAFSNPYLEDIEELLYPSLISLEEADKLVERSFISKEETVNILGDSFNTYTFSKGLAENYVEKYRGHVPTAIVRPSIVVASNAEPAAGWVDNWGLVTRTIVFFADGLDRTMLTNAHYNIDLIPVDYVANIIIVAASKLKRTNEIKVYNICSSSENPIGMGNFIELSTKTFVENKWNEVAFPMVLLTESKWLVSVIRSLQMLCAKLADGLLYFMGKQPRYVKQQSMIQQLRTVCDNFTRRSWNISAAHTCALYESLTDNDRKCFEFNPRNIVWAELLSNYMKGVQRYLYKIDID